MRCSNVTATANNHVHRSYLILKIIVRQLTQGKLTDVREEDDTDDEDKED